MSSDDLVIQPDLSVCIVVRTKNSSLAACLEGLANTAGPVDLEVIVADLSGQDQTALLASFPEIKHYEMDSHEAPSRALNRALQLAGGRYLSVWEPEAIPQRGCLENLINFLDETPDVGLAGPAVVDGYGRLESTARRFPCLSSLFSCQTPAGGSGPFREIDWLCSGVHIIRRELLEEIGYFDERFDLPFQEADYYLRAKRTGWHNFYLLQSKVVHARPGRYRAGLQGSVQALAWVRSVLWWLCKKWLTKPGYYDPMG